MVFNKTNWSVLKLLWYKFCLNVSYLFWIHFCETGTSLFIIHSVTEVVYSETLYLPDLRKFHFWIEIVQKKSSQSTVISTIKVRVDRNSTIIFFKQRFSFTYFQQTLTNVSNSSKKKQKQKKHQTNSTAFSRFCRMWNEAHAKVIFLNS